jgi:DNA-binding CsgD family transcriptional regulator
MKVVEQPNCIFSIEYLITEEGNVWSPYLNGFLKKQLDKDGYEYVKLSTLQGRKTFKIHRLTLTAFKPIPNCEYLQVNHLDFNRRNNSIENLAWVTGKENIEYNVENSRQARGSAIASSKLTETQVLEILDLLSTTKKTNLEIAASYQISDVIISDIRNGKIWKNLSKDYNLGFNKKFKPLTKEEKELIANLRKQNISVKDIAETLDKHINTIYRALRK